MNLSGKIAGAALVLLFSTVGCTAVGPGEAGEAGEAGPEGEVDETSDALGNSDSAEVSQTSRDACELVLSLTVWEEATIPHSDALDSFRERHEYGTRSDFRNDRELGSLIVLSNLELVVSSEINSDNPREVELMDSLEGLSGAASEATDIIWDFAKSPNFYFDEGAVGDEAASNAADGLRDDLLAEYQETVQELYLFLPAPLGACISLDL